MDKWALSPLDSERFGVLSARAEISHAQEIPALLAWCEAHEVRFLIVRCDAADSASIHALEQHGFLLMDTLVWYARSLEARFEMPSGVRAARPADASTIQRIAAAAFSGYRGHYHADPRLEPQACDALYIDWAVRSLQPAVADALLLATAEPAKQAVGFVALKRRDAQTVELRLYGVHPEHQGQGWGKRLVQAALAWAQQQGATRLITSTQVVNFASQRVWSELGLRMVAAQHTFHKWFDEVSS